MTYNQNYYLANKEYQKNYYKAYYAKNKIKYKIHRKEKYDILKKYYQEYYQKNKQKIKNNSMRHQIRSRLLLYPCHDVVGHPPASVLHFFSAVEELQRGVSSHTVVLGLESIRIR